MKTNIKKLTWTFVSLALVAFAVSFGTGRSSLSAKNSEDRGWDGRGVGDESRVYDCDEAGLCEEGEEHLILESKEPRALRRALGKGCQEHEKLKDETVLRCPAGVVIPDARVERIFRVTDLASNELIRASAVHAIAVNGNGVRVAVLDTGVDARHPELAGRVVAEKNFVDAVGPDDIVGHGTHVSGIVAGQGLNEIPDLGGVNSVTGVAPGVELIVGKICNDQGWCPEGDILAGIEWAVAMNAKVINLSLGGGKYLDHCDGDPMAAKANWAVRQGVVVVASAGNSGANGEGIGAPACGSKVIAVGAVNRNEVRPVWSSFGLAIDVVAPGVGILSSVPCAVTGACPNAGYDWWSGTSMAAPHVTGLVALLLEKDPSLTPAAVANIIKDTAKDLGDSGFDSLYGSGLVDAKRAVFSLIDADKDGTSAADDCDDKNPDVHPGASETCNDIDDDCDGIVDNECQSSSSSSSLSSSQSSGQSSSSLSSVSSSSSQGDDEDDSERGDDDDEDDDEENEDEDRKKDRHGDRDDEDRDREDEGRDDDNGWNDDSRLLPPLPPKAAPPAQEHRREVPKGQHKKGRD